MCARTYRRKGKSFLLSGTPYGYARVRVCTEGERRLFFAGLFHRVVLSSGSALSPWASVHDANELRTKVGEQMGCSTEGDEDIADCLRGVPLETLMDAQLPEIR